MQENIFAKLVDAPRLLEAVFSPECRPSLRWLRQQQKNKAIPHVRVGRLVFFDPEAVRKALDKKFTVRAKGEAQ